MKMFDSPNDSKAFLLNCCIFHFTWPQLATCILDGFDNPGILEWVPKLGDLLVDQTLLLLSWSIQSLNFL